MSCPFWELQLLRTRAYQRLNFLYLVVGGPLLGNLEAETTCSYNDP